MRAWWRVFLRGGLTSYRALFTWLSPWILVPALLITPIFQILFFAYVGKSAGVENSKFFLIGNAIQYASIPCLAAMSNTIGDERRFQTLGLLLVSPARRLPLFLGRALPLILNGFVVSVVALTVGALVLRVALPPSTWLPLITITFIGAYSCTGLGLVTGALAMRVRETAVLDNVLYGTMLIFCGVNVALTALPSWMATFGSVLPMTHAIQAARDVAAGAPFGSTTGLLRTEALIGVAYFTIGIGMLRIFEAESRRHATLDRA